MKKQILTLTMCLALTATAALAAGTTAVQNAAPQVKTSAPTVALPQAKPSNTVMSREDAKKLFEARMAKERGHMYDSLGLSAEQKTKAEALDAKTRKEIRPLMKKVRVENEKLDKLAAKKMSSFELWKQQIVVKQAKKDVKKYLDHSKKEFESILTKEQNEKFKILDAERKSKMEKFRKEHGPGGPKMGPKPQGQGPEFMGPPPEGKGPRPEFMPPPPPEAKK